MENIKTKLITQTIDEGVWYADDVFIQDNNENVKVVELMKKVLIKYGYIVDNEDFQFEIFDDFISCFGAGGNRHCEKGYDKLILPCMIEVAYKDGFESNVAFMDILKDKYDFEYLEIMKKYNLSFIQIYVIISLLHEFGHIRHSQIEGRAYGEFTTAIFSEYDYPPIPLKFNYDSFYEFSKKYRETRLERYADRFAITVFRKHFNAWIYLAKKYVRTDKYISIGEY